MKKYLQIFTVLLIIFGATGIVSAQRATRIEFYKKSTTATVSSSLRGFKDKKVYVIRVKKGQTLSTEQLKPDSSAQYISVSITSPSGKAVGDSDASCNNRREIEDTETGDYRITVYECQKADAWRGRFRLKVSVK